MIMQEYIVFQSSRAKSTLRETIKRVFGSDELIVHYSDEICTAKFTEQEVARLNATYQVSIMTTKLLDQDLLPDQDSSSQSQ
ncbi:hypothetical protein Tsubulata_010693 [Turnera subulata]|uniref:Uncharacterized protein n=1 Tax=Turnera subulata TaxID=218843 RepID=A0A9Q0GCK7_9ROSI|nr:hypothetical protein Tsubulata_010693 [Turnera subulata]